MSIKIEGWKVTIHNENGDRLELKGEFEAEFFKEYENKQLIIDGVINWVAVSDSLPDHLEKVVMYGKRTEHNEYEIITGVLNKAGGLNDWNTYGIVMHEVTHWAKIKPPCL